MVGVAHTRIEILGTLCSGAEVWSAGFSTANPGGGALADVDALALHAVTNFVTEFFTATGIGGYYTPTTAVIGARARQMDAAGVTMAVGENILGTPAVGGAGGGGSQSLPPQCAIVASLRTGTAGARHRGRMYLPAPSCNAMTSVGRLQTSIRDNFATGLQAFFNAWNADADTFSAAVASATGGFVESINAVQVGDVVDTQRRRRDALPEAYVSRSITI